ncbi:hypothetical protein A3C19_01770 [Candidatus Kaiserbacteria bacterium RIFCSPHIGHO2_02_FULL_54_22]|uniref:Methyltransferase n=1 Tax=Candidatus Kaiserbacteria bacterium RIFCSPHIGHO2_02_FULL_54_22 TaxID=1798495 RepID=A0A1F6DJ68_9BACT|nr:MAG: hypothetical protein A3C19_01770 [Candidatus Kaiserbacteria bacterium RIFCSPHIGHO2_02_FULL_54_22]OGG68564.1 MAG: hypothetical protein A3E99_00285 [Candidatus Kaiserbacteria bacterium RIFCSPHIGHO2_12_FULL_54_16]
MTQSHIDEEYNRQMPALTKGESIAWGCSKLLEFYLQNNPDHPFEFVIDSYYEGDTFNGLPITRPSVLSAHKDKAIMIFAVSSRAVQAILKELQQQGRILGMDVFLYSDFCWSGFSQKVETLTGSPASPAFHAIAKSYYLNSVLNVATTLSGSVLFLELLKRTSGSVAEVGIFNGSNVILGARHIALGEERPFHAFDTFEGFPELSHHDPANRAVGDMKGDATFEEIRDNLSIFPFVRIHKGEVPRTFESLPEEKYGLVFYDCDLYQPALDTFEYFWKRILPGGYLFIHDYFAEKGGYVGVRKAVNEFFPNEPKAEFWETTGCVIRKTQ